MGTASLYSKKRRKAHFAVPGFAHAASQALRPPSPEGTLVEQSTQGHVTEGLTYFSFYLLESIPIFSLQLCHILTKLKFATFGIKKNLCLQEIVKWKFVSHPHHARLVPQKHPHCSDVSPLCD